jgi:hypothetical protein
MRCTTPIVFAALAVGCRAEAPEDTEPTCGAPVIHDGVQVKIRIEDGYGHGNDGAGVILYDLTADPKTILGHDALAPDANYEIVADGVTDLPGCWDQLSYQLHLTGNSVLDIDVTADLEQAILAGTPLDMGTVDLP